MFWDQNSNHCGIISRIEAQSHKCAKLEEVRELFQIGYCSISSEALH